METALIFQSNHEQKQSGRVLSYGYMNGVDFTAQTPNQCQSHFEFFCKDPGEITISLTSTKPGENSLPAQQITLVPPGK